MDGGQMNSYLCSICQHNDGIVPQLDRTSNPVYRCELHGLIQPNMTVITCMDATSRRVEMKETINDEDFDTSRRAI